MSKVNMVAFWQKVVEDPELRERLNAIPRESRDEAMAEVVRIAGEIGLPITVEELIESGKETTDGLTEDELAGVAGGIGGPGSALTEVDSILRSFKPAFFNSFTR